MGEALSRGEGSLSADTHPSPQPSPRGRGGLLDGIKILDLTTVLAGPLASYQLALLGADVIKIEVPGKGDLARQFGARPGASFVAINGGKRSLTLNLKHPRGKHVFQQAVSQADVL